MSKNPLGFVLQSSPEREHVEELRAGAHEVLGQACSLAFLVWVWKVVEAPVRLQERGYPIRARSRFLRLSSTERQDQQERLHQGVYIREPFFRGVFSDLRELKMKARKANHIMSPD